MIKKGAKITTLTLATIMTLSSVAFAAEGDHFIDGELKYNANEVRANVVARNHVRSTPGLFQMEVNEKLFSLVDVNREYRKDKDNWKKNLIGEEVSELKVVGVSAINGTRVTVNVVGEPKAADFTVTDSNGAVYAVVNAVKAEDGIYDLILGTPVKGVGTLTVKVGNTEASKTFNTEIEGINLSMEVADEDNVLVADGADNTIITVKVLRDGLVDESFKGAVKFMSLKGARFAKEEVAFDKGVAKVQLNSISSAILIEDTIIATISDAEDTDAIGKQVRTNIVYNPESGSDDELAKRVFLTYAESNTASNLFLKFNDEFNFDEFRKAFKQNDINIIIKRTRDNTPIATNTLIHDVVKLDSKTVKVVLKEEGALIDNAEINVEVKGNGTIDSMIQDFNIDFNFVDSTPSTAVNVQAVEYDVLEAQFTEAVAKNSATKFSNWVLNGTKLSDTHVEKIEIGILDNQFTPVVYDNVNQKDNRMFATITLTPAGVKLYRGEGKTNLLQAYNIADYAEVTDGSGQNIATTQEFEFKTPVLPEAGKVEFVQQSVEQFKLDFGEVVSNAVLVETELVDGKVPASDKGTIIVERKTTNAAGEVVWVLMNSTKADNEVELSYDGNGVYYLELKQDWTVTLDTDGSGDNYYKPGFNELRVTVRNVEKDADGVDLPDADKIQITSDRTGTAIAKNVKVFNLELDTSAPKFEEVKQSKNALGKFLASVDIDFNEPVKFPGDVNTEGDTASQQQVIQGGVPVPTFEFVSADRKTTLEGKMSGLTEDDMFFVVEPKTGTLKAGEWDVIVRSISDDVGNTSDTLVKRITIVTAEAVAKKEIPAVLWAEAYNDVYSTLADKNADKVSDVVFIQFGAEMSVDAFKSAFYQINDKNLPEGVNITATETEFVAAVTTAPKSDAINGTLIKIELPSTFYFDANVASGITTPQMLNINKRLETEAGVVINSPTEIEMSYLRARAPKLGDYDYSVKNIDDLISEELLGGVVGAVTPPVVEADLNDYYVVLAAVEELVEEDYTPETWEALQTALVENAVTVENTQDEVDEAVANIQEAIDELAPAEEDKTSLIESHDMGAAPFVGNAYAVAGTVTLVEDATVVTAEANGKALIVELIEGTTYDIQGMVDGEVTSVTLTIDGVVQVIEL